MYSATDMAGQVEGGQWRPSAPGGSHWSVGAVLREAREAGGESILDISNATRIRPEHLYALEDETYHELPGWAFAISYVRTYAEYLGLDPRPLVLHVKEQLALREHLGHEYTFETEIAAPRRWPWLPILLILAIVGAGAWLLASPPGSLAALFQPVPARLHALVDRSFFAVAEGEAPVERSGMSLAASAPDAPAASEPAAADPRPAEVLQGPRFAPLREGSADETAQVRLVTHPAGAVDRDAPVMPEITLRAAGPTLVTVEDAAGGVLLAEELATGALFRLPREPGLKISAEDGGAVEVYLNGELAGILSGPGNAVHRVAVERLVGAGASGGS